MANWTIEERRQIWNKGQVVPGYVLLCGVKTNAGRLSSGTCMGIDLTVIIMDGR